MLILGVCDKSYVVEIFYLMKLFYKLACYIVPPMIILVTSYHLLKSIRSGKSEDLKDEGKVFVRRFIAGVIVMLSPTLINVIFNDILDTSSSEFLTCFETASREKVESLMAKEEAEEEKKRAQEEAEDKARIELYKKHQEEKSKAEAEKRAKEEAISQEKNKGAENSGQEGARDGELPESIDSNSTGNAWVQQLLSGAKEVTDYIRAHHFSYGYATVNPALDQSQGIVACDNCVGWFLYKAGYTDNQPSFYGLDLASSQTYMESHGFTKITDKSQLQAGDIVYVNPDSSGFPGHVFLLGNYIGDGIWERYDCGSDNRISLSGQYSGYSSQPFHEPINNFAFAYRSPKAVGGSSSASGSSGNSNISISTTGVSPSSFDSKVQNMKTPTTAELEAAAAKNGITSEYLKIIIGTTEREGYLNDHYLYYGWASAMINVPATLSQMQGWDPYHSGDANYYSWVNILDGYNNASPVVLKAVYLALTEINTKIVECNGMYSSTPSSYNLLYDSQVYPCSIYELK